MFLTPKTEKYMPSIVSAIQMCSSSSVQENLKIAEQLILEASQNHAKLIVLPEMFAIMADTTTTKLDVKESFGNGKIQSFLSDQAKRNKVWIIGGTIPIECNYENKINAASLVFDDTGRCVARYDKIHLFDVVLSNQEIYRESDTTKPGNNLTIIDTPFGKVGLAICYDLRFPELFRWFFNHGVEIIVLPTAFTEKTGKAHWEVLARSRAIENFCYFIGACQGGLHSNGRRTFGNSIIIGPWGEVVAKKENIDPGVIYATIDLKNVYNARKSIPIEKHQRIFFDISKLDPM